jgi:hypothetical protein
VGSTPLRVIFAGWNACIFSRYAESSRIYRRARRLGEIIVHLKVASDPEGSCERNSLTAPVRLG